jgi:hypothetical protein
MLLAALAGVAACGDIDGGGGSFPGTVAYESPGQTFHFHLLEPPWVPVTLQDETIFLVPASEISVSVTAQESDALFSLHVAAQSGDAATAFQTQASAHAGVWDLTKKQTFTAVGGQAGVEISWQEEPDVFHREAHVTGASAQTSFQLLFTAKSSLAGDPMIRQMIVSFGPGPNLGVAP